jgi:hypothetical protein
MFPSHGAGKGDADRSPGWREHYDEIEWGDGHNEGHHNVTRTFHKTYGPAAPKRLHINEPDWRKDPTELESLNREIEKIIDECDARFVNPPAAFEPTPETKAYQAVNYNEGYKCQE